MQYIARSYTAPTVAWLEKTPRCLLWADVGMGKTSLILMAALRRHVASPVFPMLVVSTKEVVTNTWKPEVNKWDFSQGLVCQLIDGDAMDRITKLSNPAHIYLINFDLVPWLITVPGQVGRFKSLVVDESTQLAGHRVHYERSSKGNWFLKGKEAGGKEASCLAYYMAPYVNWFVGATGTPVADGLDKVWGQAWFCDSGKALGLNYTKFMEDFFYSPPRQGSKFPGKPKPHPYAFDEIMRRIKPFTLILQAKDYWPVQEERYTLRLTRLTEQETVAYKQFAKKQLLELETQEKTLVREQYQMMLMSKVEKLLQFASGFMIPPRPDGDAPQPPPHTLHHHKLDALSDLVEEIGRPVIVAYYYQWTKDQLKKRFKGIRFIGDDADPNVVDDWNKGKIPILGLHWQSGRGLNLQYGGCDMIFIDLRWSAEMFTQTVNRIGALRQMQSGLNRLVNIYVIATNGTADLTVYERLKSKQAKEDDFKKLFTL